MASSPERQSADSRGVDASLHAILKLRVPVIVRLGERSMSLGEVVSLVPGSIIELPKNADDELDLLVNDKPIGAGAAVKVGEKFGLRISQLGPPRAVAIAATSPEPGGDLDELSAMAEEMLANESS